MYHIRGESILTFLEDRTTRLPRFQRKQTWNNDQNFKSKIIEWSQKENKNVTFQVIEADSDKHFKRFEASVLLNKKSDRKGFWTYEEKG